MIQIVPPDRAFDQSVLQVPGGFAWWYLDLLNDQGDGLVLIWFFALPFLPNTSKNVAPSIALSRPGVCVAVYRRYQQSFYLLQEDVTSSIQIEDTSSEITIGASRFSIQSKSGRALFTAHIETELAGSRQPLVGMVRAQGPHLNGLGDRLPSHVHTWSPLLTSTEGHARLTLGEREIIDMRGPVYLDRNASSEPLGKLGIDQWRWGHLAFADRELIFYQLLPAQGGPPQSFAVSVAKNGEALVTGADLRWSGPKQDLYGLKWHRCAELSDPQIGQVQVRFRSLVDNGPFYLRFFIEATETASGKSGIGFAELVRPERIDLPAMRHFIQMRIHRKNGPNSLMLPFFSGENRGRLGRYFSHLIGSIFSTRVRS
jgi:carotenoid 1,2-hydratase